MMWPSLPRVEDHSKSVPIIIEHDDGTTEHFLDQSQHQNAWVDLGNYHFTSGKQYSVSVETRRTMTTGTVLVGKFRAEQVYVMVHNDTSKFTQINPGREGVCLDPIGKIWDSAENICFRFDSVVNFDYNFNEYLFFTSFIQDGNIDLSIQSLC